MGARTVGRYFTRSSFLPSPVPILSIECTNFCNSKCVYCANSNMQTPRQHLDMEKYKKAIDEFVAMGGVDINFNSCIGEPLLDPTLVEKIKYLRKYPQLKFEGFFTTLQWLHKFNLGEFFEMGNAAITISTSLSGKEKYCEFFGEDLYEQALKNILTLIEENKKRANPLKILFMIVPTNEPIDAVVKHPDFYLVDSLTDKAATRGLKAFVDDWFGKVNLPSYMRKRPIYFRAFAPCAIMLKRLVVFSNGKIGICPSRDYEQKLVLGDISRDSLKDAWNSEPLNKLRNDWRKKNIIPDICLHCGRYEVAQRK